MHEENLHQIEPEGAIYLAGLDLWIAIVGVSIDLGVLSMGIGGRVAEAGAGPFLQILAESAWILVVAASITFWPPVLANGLGSGFMSGGVFFRAWAILWLTQVASAHVMLAFNTVVGPKAVAGNFTYLILSLWSSTAVYAHEFSPHFYQIGLGLPMLQGIQGMRTIQFGSYDRVARNVGILLGWLGLALIVLLGRAARNKFRCKH